MKLAKEHWHQLFSWRTVARLAQAQVGFPSYQINSRCYFGIKQYPRNTDLSSSDRSDVPLCKWHKKSRWLSLQVVSTCLKMPYAVPCDKFLQRETRIDLQLRLVPLAKRCVWIAGGPKTVFRGLCSTQNCLWIQFRPRVSLSNLVLNSGCLVESSEHNLL